MPTLDESSTSNDGEWISYEEATALVWQALPEFKGDGEAAQGVLIRAFENGEVRCRDLYKREMDPNDIRDGPLSYVNISYAYLGGIKATRWWGVRNAFPALALGPASGASAKKRASKGITDFWPHVLGRCAACLARHSMPEKQKDLEDMLVSLIEDAGRSAEPSTVRRYAAGLRAGWRSEAGD